MNFLLTDEQTQIVDTLKSFLSGQAPVARFRPPAPQVGNSDHDLWPQLAELGYLGIALSEDAGGIGLTAAEEMLAYREFGRQLLSPAVLGLTLAVQLAARADSDLLPELLRGRMRVGLANPLGAVTLGPTCAGTFHLMDGHDAAWILACGPAGAALLRSDAFTEIVAVAATDSAVTLGRARLAAAKPRIWVASSQWPSYQRAQLLIGAYAVGMAEATRDMAVDYAKARQQFGKPIGSFQAIKHLCADMAIRSEAALCQVIFASLVQAEDLDGAAFHSIAGKLVATGAALQNAAQNIQVHGAIGFTAEADAHVYLKRSHLMEQLWGDTRHLRESMLAAEFPG
jgi:alkylation response protein AidB-like acyl-CoA dehydrogenase